MIRKVQILFIASVVLLVLVPACSASSGQDLVITVYSDGYVVISQVVPVEQSATSVQIPLLATTVSGLVATDQNGSPLSYSFGSGGRNVTVYTLGASEVELTYDTDNLTSKSGSVWSLGFTSLYNSTVILPERSTLVSVSGTPYTINETGSKAELTLAPGSWAIDYGVPFSVSAATPPQGSTTTSSNSSASPSPYVSLSVTVVLALLIVVVFSTALYLWWRSRGISPSAGELRPDDIRVLDFIREKGGRVMEPEIRMKFALPKTSAWRQIKRLERLGYVRVAKIGSQNQIELLKEREPGR